ncbi:hemolysin [Vibrio sp. S9_S30]|uniref:hemolysin n=1 Tax=Vibrio sp. S9_S30 TaxID=2720226 RepID=UPI001681764C|nr:hemolysin [Vibrio sp. S9_S30]MBD1555989.1 hemolysin [Vibrio sp. S9_S30]
MLRTPLMLSTVILGVSIQTPVNATTNATTSATEAAKACIVSRETGAKYCLEAGQRSGYSLPSYIRGHDVDVIAPEGLGVMLSDWDNLSYNRLAVFERHTHNEAMENVLARNGQYLDFSNPRSMRVISTERPDEACIVSRQTGAEYCLKAGQRSGYSLPYYIRGHEVDVIAPEGLAVMLSDWDNLSYNRLAVFTKDTNNEDLENVLAYNRQILDFSRPRSMRVLSHATVPTNKQLIQDFDDFADQYDKVSWGLVEFDNNGQPVTEDDKSTFVEGREILFQVKWTERTLRSLLSNASFETLKASIGVDRIRELVDEYCPARLEVGTHATYRHVTAGNTSELDSANYHCPRGTSIYVDGTRYPLYFARSQASTVIIESFLPTIPGATYELNVVYQKRNYSPRVNPDQAFRELVAKIAGNIQSVSVSGLADIEHDSHTSYLPVIPMVNGLDGAYTLTQVFNHSDTGIGQDGSAVGYTFTLPSDSFSISVQDDDNLLEDNNGSNNVEGSQSLDRTEQGLAVEFGAFNKGAYVHSRGYQNVVNLTTGQQGRVYQIRIANNYDPATGRVAWGTTHWAFTNDMIVKKGDTIELTGSFTAGGNVTFDKLYASSEAIGDGFKSAKITFKADRFFTPISLEDTGHPDSWGILVTKVESNEIQANPYEMACQMFYPNDPERQKACLTSTGEPTVPVDSCNLSIDENLGNFVVNKQGYRAQNEPFRYVPQNIFDSRNYYSVGKGGIATLNLASNGVSSGCDIQGKTLSLDEFTGNNWNYQRFAEQGLTKVLLACEQGNETVLNWETLETAYPDNLLITNHKISKTFNDDKYAGCKLRAIRFVDRTHKIPSYQQGYSAISDGFDIRNLKLD